MLEAIKPYLAVIKVALFVVLILCVGMSYWLVFQHGVSTERAVWELQVSEDARRAAEQKLKDIEAFNKKINEMEAKATEEAAAAQAKIKGFEDYVDSIKDDSSCLTDSDTRELRKLWGNSN